MVINRLKVNQCQFNHRNVEVNGRLCYLTASNNKNKKGKPELQIIVSFNKPEEAQSFYKERWQIETAFRALKTSGFNIEDTHLADIGRIEKLFCIGNGCFVWAYKAGVCLNAIYPIKIKKHGSRAKSFFKYGLKLLASALFSADIDKFRECCDFLSCT